MSEQSQKDQYKRFLLVAIGCFILVLGMSLILRYWAELIIFAKGVSGMVLAVGGLVMLYGLNKK